MVAASRDLETDVSGDKKNLPRWLRAPSSWHWMSALMNIVQNVQIYGMLKLPTWLVIRPAVEETSWVRVLVIAEISAVKVRPLKIKEAKFYNHMFVRNVWICVKPKDLDNINLACFGHWQCSRNGSISILMAVLVSNDSWLCFSLHKNYSYLAKRDMFHSETSAAIC